MPPKNDICRNFQRGSCQYGERCRFLHQRPNTNPFGFGSQQQQQNRSSNPSGFGENKKQKFKPFENKWTRTSSTSKQLDNQPQPALNHKCTDPDSCKRQIVEDFEHEKPIWKFTCYGHSKNGFCDIVGDVSYEELRAASYDDAKRGLSFQSIVDRERNLLNSKLVEFENLLHNPYVAAPKAALSQSPFPGVTPNAITAAGQNNARALVSSFSQLGQSLDRESNTWPSATSNHAFGLSTLFFNSSQTPSAVRMRPSAPSNNAFGQPNVFCNSSQTSGAFGINGFTPANAGGFSNSSAISNQSRPFSSSAVQTQFTHLSTTQPVITSNAPTSAPTTAAGQATKDFQSVNGMQSGTVSRDARIWLKESWPGEIPEEAPPDEYI